MTFALLTLYSQVYVTLVRLATGHKPGILRKVSEYGKLREPSCNSVQHQGKFVTNKIVFVFKHLCETPVEWVNSFITVSLGE